MRIKSTLGLLMSVLVMDAANLFANGRPSITLPGCALGIAIIAFAFLFSS